MKRVEAPARMGEGSMASCEIKFTDPELPLLLGRRSEAPAGQAGTSPGDSATGAAPPEVWVRGWVPLW